MHHPQHPHRPVPPGRHLEPPPATSGLRIGLGLCLLAVPVLALVVAYLMPTLRTVSLSLQSGSAILGDSRPVGTENYDRAFGDAGFLDAFQHASSVALAAVLLGAVGAPLIAWCLHSAGAATRMAARIVWGAAVVAYAPAAMTIALFLERYSGTGVADLSLTGWATLMFGVVTGAGGLVALAAFRGGAEPARPAKAVVTVAGLTAFALAAAALQTFTFTHVTGVPAPPGALPLVHVYSDGFRMLQFGLGAAKSTVLLALLAVLGLGAALLFILSRTRIEVTPGPGLPRAFRTGPGVPGILLLVAVATATVLALLPWLTRMTGGSGDPYDPTEVWFDTWVPPLITTGVGLASALTGGFAIGALRPLGDGSRWLLLLFAPWLFVGSGPLLPAHYEAMAEAERLGTFAALVPRAWVAVPALFVFTALFWGLEDRRRTTVALGVPASRANGAFAAAAWPLVALVAMILWLVNANDVVWQTAFGEVTAAQAVLLSVQSAFSAEDAGVGLGYPLPLLAVFTAAMVAAAVFYLPRVGILVGRRGGPYRAPGPEQRPRLHRVITARPGLPAVGIVALEPPCTGDER